MHDVPNPPQSSKFPILQAIGRLVRMALANWRQRHQLPFNFWIHMVGIPMAVSSLVVVFFTPWLALALFGLGYLLQWIGHRAEGNDVGELIPFKRLLGLPVVSISPRWTATESAPPLQPAGVDSPSPAS